jgi:hypothetical protein
MSFPTVTSATKPPCTTKPRPLPQSALAIRRLSSCSHSCQKNGTGERHKLSRRILALAARLDVAALLMPRFALAEDDLAVAISHAEAAIDHGTQKHAEVATKHAEEAETNLEAATK